MNSVAFSISRKTHTIASLTSPATAKNNMITMLSRQALVITLATLSTSAFALNPITKQVREHGMAVNLDEFRMPASTSDGMDIPLSYEVLEIQDPAVAVTKAATVAPSQTPTARSDALQPVALVTDASPVETSALLPLPVRLIEASAPEVTFTVTSVTTKEGDSDKLAEPVEQAELQEPAEAIEETVNTVQEPVEKVQEPVKKVEQVEKVKEAEPVDKVDEAFKSIVKAMKPAAPVKSLSENRLSFYLSEKVAALQLEFSGARFKSENSRLHVATMYSEKRDSVIHGGIALDTSLTEKLRLSFGARAYIALLNMENVDIFATAVGTEAAYLLPFKFRPMELSASIYYAPDIMTFGSADRAIDAQVDIVLPFRSKSAVFAGVRYLQIDTNPEDREVDNRLHLGFRRDI